MFTAKKAHNKRFRIWFLFNFSVNKLNCIQFVFVSNTQATARNLKTGTRRVAKRGKKRWKWKKIPIMLCGV